MAQIDTNEIKASILKENSQEEQFLDLIKRNQIDRCLNFFSVSVLNKYGKVNLKEELKLLHTLFIKYPKPHKHLIYLLIHTVSPPAATYDTRAAVCGDDAVTASGSAEPYATDAVADFKAAEPYGDHEMPYDGSAAAYALGAPISAGYEIASRASTSAHSCAAWPPLNSAKPPDFVNCSF